MPLGALSLAVSTGVHGREFKAKISGLTTGVAQVLAEGAPGFDVVNGFLVNLNLPGASYRPLTAVVREFEPGGSPAFRDTRLTIAAFDMGEVRSQALSLVTQGAELRQFGAFAESDGTGSLVWKVFAVENTGVRREAAVTGAAPAFTPALQFNDARNSQYLPLLFGS